MTREEARTIILALPGVVEEPRHGTLGFKANGTVLCRIGSRLGPDDLILKGVGFDEREMLIEREPATFHTTPHYSDADCVLARLASLDADVLRAMLTRRWRQLARKAELRAWDALHPENAP